jgi:hypothetical protein
LHLSVWNYFYLRTYWFAGRMGLKPGFGGGTVNSADARLVLLPRRADRHKM